MHRPQIAFTREKGQLWDFKAEAAVKIVPALHRKDQKLQSFILERGLNNKQEDSHWASHGWLNSIRATKDSWSQARKGANQAWSWDWHDRTAFD